MDKIFTAIRRWLAFLAESGSASHPLDTLTMQEFADLPTVHPAAR